MVDALVQGGEPQWRKRTECAERLGTGIGKQISFGWEIFETVFYGGDGIIYAIRPDGRMHWYKDEDRPRRERGECAERLGTGIRNQISFGWEIFETVFYGGDGMIYAVRPDGRMHWYKDEDRRGRNGRMRRTVWQRVGKIKSASVGEVLGRVLLPGAGTAW